MSTEKAKKISLSFGRRLLAERKRLGLTQKEAAEGCNVSREMWGRYERDDTSPGAGVLENFVSLGARPDFLLGGKESEHEAVAGLLLMEIAAQLELYDAQGELERIADTLAAEKKRDWGETASKQPSPGGQVRASELTRQWLARSPHVILGGDWLLLEDAMQTLEFALSVSGKDMSPQEKVAAVQALWKKAKQSGLKRVDLNEVKALLNGLPSLGKP